MCFVLSRATDDEQVGWRERNKRNKYLKISAIDYMPIIVNPTHEDSTL